MATPLHKACWKGEPTEVSKLLSEGANPFWVSIGWYSAKDIAVFGYFLQAKLDGNEWRECYDLVANARCSCGKRGAKRVSPTPV